MIDRLPKIPMIEISIKTKTDKRVFFLHFVTNFNANESTIPIDFVTISPIGLSIHLPFPSLTLSSKKLNGQVAQTSTPAFDLLAYCGHRLTCSQ